MLNKEIHNKIFGEGLANAYLNENINFCLFIKFVLDVVRGP